MSQTLVMTSTRPYLIRAFYDWIMDNNGTPHIVVNASFVGVEVPQEYVQNGQIVLNVALSAVSAFKMSEIAIEFQARFSGRVRVVYIPCEAVLAIYAKENGRGMVFAEEGGEPPIPPQRSLAADRAAPSTPKKATDSKESKKRPSHLTVVK